MASQVFDSNDPNVAAVDATHTNPVAGSAAIIARSDGRGVLGVSEAGQGVWGHSTTNIGTAGVSASGVGVQGVSETGTGVFGQSTGGFGVHGVSASNTALLGVSTAGIGLLASTDTGEAAVRGDHHNGGFAGVFNGSVLVTLNVDVNGNLGVLGDVSLVGADVAEEFDAIQGEDIEPGSVVVLADGDHVMVSSEAYDRRVVGVVSGAGGCRPGVVLDRQPTPGRWPLALVGKVWCKVVADDAPIEVGDLLTTSTTPGHAMRASDPVRSFGAVLGKALGDRRTGRGLLPMLVALR
jgi:hypothetical protein